MSLADAESFGQVAVRQKEKTVSPGFFKWWAMARATSGHGHKKLTFRHNGADRRPADMHGEVIHEVLAPR
jgi:hypothetical protein